MLLDRDEDPSAELGVGISQRGQPRIMPPPPPEDETPSSLVAGRNFAIPPAEEAAPPALMRGGLSRPVPPPDVPELPRSTVRPPTTGSDLHLSEAEAADQMPGTGAPLLEDRGSFMGSPSVPPSAIGQGQLVKQKPRVNIPAQDYHELKDEDPVAYEQIKYLATNARLSPVDLAAVVKASREKEPPVTEDEQNLLDPEHRLDLSNQRDKFIWYTVKLKAAQEVYGHTPEALAAFYAGHDAVDAMHTQPPGDHRRLLPEGTLDFVNRVLGRGPKTVKTPEAPSSGLVPGQVTMPGVSAPPPTTLAGPSMGEIVSDPYQFGQHVTSRLADVNRAPGETASAIGEAVAGTVGPAVKKGTEAYAETAVPAEQAAGSAISPEAMRSAWRYGSEFVRGAIGAGRSPPPEVATVPVPPTMPPRPDQLTEPDEYYGPRPLAIPPLPNQPAVAAIPPAPPPGIQYARGGGAQVPGAAQPPPPLAIPETAPLPVPKTGLQPGGPKYRVERPDLDIETEPPEAAPAEPPPPPPTSETARRLLAEGVPGQTTAIPPVPGAPAAPLPGTGGTSQRLVPTGLEDDPVARDQGKLTQASVDLINARIDEVQKVAGPGVPVRVLGVGPDEVKNSASINDRIRKIAEAKGAVFQPYGAPSVLATPGAAPAATTAAGGFPNSPDVTGKPRGVGDSLMLHAQGAGAVTGTSSKKPVDPNNTTDDAAGGRSPETVLKYLKSLPDGAFKGQNIVFSSGASNNPGQINMVQDQFAELRRLGANSVRLVGVGDTAGSEDNGKTQHDLGYLNDYLKNYAQANGASFMGPIKGTIVHPPKSYYAGAIANTPIAAAGAAPAPTTTAQAIPTPGLPPQRVMTDTLHPTPTPTTAPSAGAGTTGSTPAPTTAGGGGGEASAAELNAQELARIRGGAAPAVGAGASPPAAAPGAAPAAPAAAAVGAGPPAAANAPVTSLSTDRPSLITPQGAVAASRDAGPDGVLTYISEHARPGSSAGAAWDQLRFKMRKYFIMKGDPVAGQHAEEYVFQMQHAGAFQNLAKGYGLLQAGRPDLAAPFIAKSHAFVSDGAMIGLQVLNNKLYLQKFDEVTHQPIGNATPVTADGVRGMLNMTADPKKFSDMMHAERTANETRRHDEAVEYSTLRGQDMTAQTAITREREAMERSRFVQEQANQRAAAVDLRSREATQARLAANQEAQAAREAQTASALRTTVSREIADTYGANAPVDPTDLYGQKLTGPQKVASSQIFNGIRTGSGGQIEAPAAQEIARHLMLPDTDKNKAYTTQILRDPTGKKPPQVGIFDRNANNIAYIPLAMAKSWMPNEGEQTRGEKARAK